MEEAPNPSTASDELLNMLARKITKQVIDKVFQNTFHREEIIYA